MDVMAKIYNRSPIIVQHLMLNGKAFELYQERYGSKFRRMFRKFQENQWLSASELEAMQNGRLAELIGHAYETVPYYRRIMRERGVSPRDIAVREDLQKLPLLTKQDIRNHFKDLISKTSKKLMLRHGHTSGTSGSPLNVEYDISTCVVHHAADWRQKRWAGLVFGEAYASIQGRVIVPIRQKRPPFWRKNIINNQLFLSSFHLMERNLPYYFEKLQKDRIRYLEGYPSTTYILAMYLNKHRQTFPLEAVLTSSETLFDYQRGAIEKAFCCKIFNFYGMAERVVFATECNHHQGLHLNEDYGITEFLDSNHQPVARGKHGRIVATGLHNFGMPLIRYVTNDSCGLQTRACTCGRGFPLMEDVATKNESIVTLPDGRLISPSVLTHPFKPMHNIIESQIIQEETDRLLIKIVKNESYSQTDEKKLITAFKERLGEDVHIDISYVQEIPRTQSGKFKWVVSKIEPHF